MSGAPIKLTDRQRELLEYLREQVRLDRSLAHKAHQSWRVGMNVTRPARVPASDAVQRRYIYGHVSVFSARVERAAALQNRMHAP